ncbi:chromosome segregation protein SMC [bacterium]|nr:chromosome segregation protein SMC [bacterium]
MKLKRLEIIGFKSFMEKTVVTFEKDITAVVGPNGCGKSNIVDAIRWVMGEQSAKHLRGKNMEDVIFAGSDGHAPQSMAHVELTFSTDGGVTPVEYLGQSEISVCRRLYRSGESEYFLNKVPCRLKDITELFLGTGIGKRAYSVIEQGRVAQVITAKPEERRFYIEEVAGISRFKARKEAALRKMEATQQNILRLTDIITELDRQMKSLDRQAKKAEKYREVKTEFTTWDLKLASYLFKNNQTEQHSLEKVLREADEKENQTRTLILEEENALEELKLIQLEKERAVNRIQNDFFETTNIIRLAENTLLHKRQLTTQITREMDDIKKHVYELSAEMSGMGNGVEQINEQKLLADCDEESLREETEMLQQEVDNLELQMMELTESFEHAKSRSHQIDSRITQINTIEENLKNKREDLLTRMSRQEMELEGLKKNYQGLSHVYRDANESLNNLKQLKLNLTSKTDELALDLHTQKQLLVSKQAELKNLKDDLTLKRSRLKSLEELEKTFEGYQEGPRSVLLKKEEISADGILGTIADGIETDPVYESAVSAVLGEKLQYVVVKSQAQGVSAIDYLQTSGSGRSSFVPIESSSFSGSHIGDYAHQEGVVGPLKQFVNFKNGYDKLGDYLFGDAVVVDTLQRALGLWEGGYQDKTLVTMDGAVVDKSGIITGGTLASTSKALLEKKREIKELLSITEHLSFEVSQNEDTLYSLTQKVETLTSTLEEVKSTSVEEEIKLATQVKDLDHCRKEMEKLSDQQQVLLKQIENEKISVDAIEPELQNLNIERDSLAEEKLGLTDILQNSRGRLEVLKESFDTKNDNLTRLKVELAQAGERNTHLSSEINRLSDEQFRIGIEKITYEERLSFLDSKTKLLASEQAHLDKVLDKKLTKHADLESQLSQEREAFEGIGNKIRDRELFIRERRKEHEEASQQLNEVTLKLADVRNLTKNLVEQCLERHMLSLSEVCDVHYDTELNVEEAKALVAELKDKLARLGEVNTAALEEFEEIKTRFEFLSKQRDDLNTSLEALERVIQKINRTTKDRFFTTFNMVNERFKVLFPKLFRGGRAELLLTDENNILETGVEIVAQPPGKKLQSISLLSGGEKALTSVSLIFSIFQIKPSPFCLLDEVDAPLDEANVHRYNELIRDMTSRTQFVVITHNKNTMQMADTMYGVTMQTPGVSQLVSVEMH